jgi:hypothetical protein
MIYYINRFKPLWNDDKYRCWINDDEIEADHYEEVDEQYHIYYDDYIEDI